MAIAGIDLGIAKVAISVLDGDNLHVYVRHSDAASRGNQLFDLATYASVILSVWEVPSVFIESILVGNNSKYSIQLAQTMGAVLSALVSYPVYQVNVGTWKKEVLGNGSSKKDQVRAWLEANYPAYAVSCDGDQDSYDATCIALYGQGVLARSGLLLEELGPVPH